MRSDAAYVPIDVNQLAERCTRTARFVRLTEIEGEATQIVARGSLPLRLEREASGRIALVAATDLDEWAEIIDPSGTLVGAKCRGGVDVLPIDCKHLDLLKEPHEKGNRSVTGTLRG